MSFVAAARPEIAVGIGICVVLIADLFAPLARRNASYPLAMATLVAGAWLAATSDPAITLVMPGGAFTADRLARILKLFSFAIVAGVFVYARSYLRARRLSAGEFHVLGLFALLGILIMSSAASFLVMYLGLETLSLALYAMVACERDSPVAAEAAIKYFVLGAIASGCLLYGIAVLYGVTGSISFGEVANALRSNEPVPLAALFGLGFILVGIAFKFGAVPFHMWLPDVYQGAPACVTLFVATAPKLAAFALGVRILVDGLAPMQGDWQAMLAVVAVLSLAIGNLVAIVQSNLKRLLAYSTIGHMGFVLLGILAAKPQGLQAALFYTLVYAIMTMGAFGIVILMSSGATDAEQLDDLKGLNQRSPWFAAVMLLIMVSMIGVPPLAGFYAKWWVLSALLDSGHTWLALAGILFSVIGAFYYLRIVHLMYFDERKGGEAVLQPAMDLRLLLSANALLLLGIGIFPGRLLELCARALLGS
jgi:NADH-quinone oxidoreductase subunit N